ncbi:DinB family protein [Cellulomonas denverensis]|uniref:DinB family protein n=1 Tax=Cellulomonas denverensis TaxID=264297 RepID=A0A7X6KU32_9CELL|nr:DinB family protein [Cellulomonas denverensis]NKY22321.1 DinB family protein [Cellulomonas denverensis]
MTLDPHGRPEPPLAADEATMLLAYLDYHRATLDWKTRGLDPAGLATTVGRSTMTLGGLLAHLAYVEDSWITWRLRGEPAPEPWTDVDWEADIDYDWHLSRTLRPAQLRELWDTSVQRSRAAVELALAEDGLDAPVRRPWSDGRAPTLRWVLVHLVEEYARHNGHADLLREQADGQVGE